MAARVVASAVESLTALDVSGAALMVVKEVMEKRDDKIKRVGNCITAVFLIDWSMGSADQNEGEYGLGSRREIVVYIPSQRARNGDPAFAGQCKETVERWSCRTMTLPCILFSLRASTLDEQLKRVLLEMRTESWVILCLVCLPYC